MTRTALVQKGIDEGVIDVDRYIADNNILVNPLQYDGYPSIGCWPCTRRVEIGEDARAGRWAGTNKTECGIHQ